MNELEEFLTLIQDRVMDPYRKIICEPQLGQMEQPPDLRHRIYRLSVIRKRLPKMKRQLFRLSVAGQEAEKRWLEECLACFERLLDRQLLFSRMMSHRQIGAGLDIKEYKRVGFEISCLEKQIDQYLSSKVEESRLYPQNAIRQGA